MNKKTLLFFGVVGLLLITLVVILLVGNVWKISNAQGGTHVPNETNTLGTDDSATEQSLTTETNATGEAPAFQVDFGVGDQGTFDTTDPTKNTQQSQNAAPSQEQMPGGNLSIKDSKNGMPAKLLTYEEFLALSNGAQQEYFQLFADPLDYARWLQQAKQVYEDKQVSIIVTGPVDLETLP